MLDVIHGGVTDTPLFVPRLDIWYNANKARGSLPKGYQDLSLREITHKLGVGFHSVIPDFIRTGNVEDIHHRALGFYNHPDFPYRADFSNIDYKVERTDHELITRYLCDSGEIVTRIRYDKELFNSGMSIPDITEHAVKGPDDYLRLTEILGKVEIVPQPDHYARYRSRIGDDGMAVAYLSAAGGPRQHIMRDLRKYEAFCLDMYDAPDKIQALCEVLGTLYDRIIETVLDTEAEVALFGANYDETITFPPFFDGHILPWLKKASNKLHDKGKYLLTHTDGENRSLIPSYLKAGFDIADSICPAPMTKVTLEEYRAQFGNNITIWGGIPSVLMLAAACPETEFRAFIKKLIDSCRPYDNLILSVADTLPPEAKWGRVEYICEIIKR